MKTVVRPVETKFYICDYCETDYLYENIAKECEIGHAAETCNHSEQKLVWEHYSGQLFRKCQLCERTGVLVDWDVVADTGFPQQFLEELLQLATKYDMLDLRSAEKG